MRQRWWGIWFSAASVVSARVSASLKMEVLSPTRMITPSPILPAPGLRSELHSSETMVMSCATFAGFREVDCPDKADLLRSRKQAQHARLRLRPFELVKEREDRGAIDEIVAGAGMNAAVFHFARRQVPHGKGAEIARGRLLRPILLRHAAEEFLPDIARVIHVRGKGVARRRAPALIVRDHVAKEVPRHPHVRALRELHQDLPAHGVLVKRRGRLREHGANQGEEGIEIHGIYWFLVSGFWFLVPSRPRDNSKPETRNEKPSSAFALETVSLSPGRGGLPSAGGGVAASAARTVREARHPAR